MRLLGDFAIRSPIPAGLHVASGHVAQIAFADRTEFHVWLRAGSVCHLLLPFLTPNSVSYGFCMTRRPAMSVRERRRAGAFSPAEFLFPFAELSAAIPPLRSLSGMMHGAGGVVKRLTLGIVPSPETVSDGRPVRAPTRPRSHAPERPCGCSFRSAFDVRCWMLDVRRRPYASSIQRRMVRARSRPKARAPSAVTVSPRARP